MQAGAGGLRVCGRPRVLADHVQLLRGDGGQEVAHHRGVTGPDLQHLGPRGDLRREDRHGPARRPRRPDRRDPSGWNGCSTSRIARRSQMSVARTRCRSVCAKDHSPPTDTSTVPAGIVATRSSVTAQVRSSAAQAARIPSGSAARRSAAAGKATVELLLDEGGDVDTVDVQAVTVDEPRRVDVHPGHLDSAHHHAGQVGLHETRAAQVGADELGAVQLVGSGEGHHDDDLLTRG